jgi:hypothetical protein
MLCHSSDTYQVVLSHVVKMLLLYADTLAPNTTPVSIHEVRFRRPCYLRAFRIVCDGERPHTELPFCGGTPPTALTIEFFGCNSTEKKSLCTPLLEEPHRRKSFTIPSTMETFCEKVAASPCNYLVIRTVPLSLSLCIYGVEAEDCMPPELPPWQTLPSFR